MIWHILHQIDRVFRPNLEAYTNSKEPIHLKKLGQGDGAWSTRKTVLKWDLDTIAHLLRLLPTRRDKVAAALTAIPWEARTTSLRKWRNLLGLLQRITQAVAVSRSLFTRV